MRQVNNFRKQGVVRGVGVCALAFALLAMVAVAQDAGKDPKKGKQDKEPEVTTLHIEVTGGANAVPIGNASVYVRYQEPRFLRSPDKIELDLKTDLEGTTKVKDVPRMRVLIQVVKDGWRPFGQFYVLTKPEETIKIKMEPPPHWY